MKKFALLLFAALALTVRAHAATPVTSDATAWTSGEYVVTADVTVATRIQVSGSVTLTLTGGTLTAPQGIHVPEGASLTINGTSGSLVINNNAVAHACAGIGGDESEACGTITINGGNITVKGGYGGAGIGNGQTVASGGVIVINGGTVNATGGSYSAGIGGGQNILLIEQRGQTGPSITITGGDITATGGEDGAAGIGGGDTTPGGTIVISGGTVRAYGAENGPGVGGGYGTAYKRNPTSIEISGTANVTAQGGDEGAGSRAATRARESAPAATESAR